MKGLVASVVCIILVVQVLSAQGEREEGNEIQGAEDSLSNVDGTKPDEIDGWRKLRSINNVSENDLSPSKKNHKKSRRTVSLPQNTEDHDSRSSLQKCNPTRTKRDTEIPEDDISLNFDASRKSKRKSAKLKLAGVCKSGKASRKLLKAIEQNSDEDSGEKISFMDDYISPPLTSDHNSTNTLQGHQNTNGDANSDTVANSNDGLETNMAQKDPDVEMSSTRDIEPSTGNGNGDQVDQTVMDDSPSILTDEVGNSDREAAPSVGTLVELKGEPGREQQGLSGQSAVSQSEMSEGADFGPKAKVSENMELIPTRPEESTPLQSQSPVGTPLGNDGVPSNSGTDDENNMSTGTPTSQFSVGQNLPTKQNGETNYYQDSNPTATNIGTSSFPYSTTNQPMLSSIKSPLQSQSHVDNSDVTPLGMTGTYDNGLPPAAGTSDGNSEYIETPTSPSGAGLPTAQNSEAYQYEDSNPTATNIGTSSFPYSTTNQQILSSIKPPLQSQSHVENSNVTPFGMSATYDNGVSPAGVTSDANTDYIETPTSLSGAGLPTAQNSEAYHYLDSNPTASNTDTSSFPYSTTNQQMLSSIKPPLQSQSHVANSNVTPLGTSATYDNGVPLAAGTSDGNSEYIETPTLPSDAGLPTAQNSEAYQYEDSNPTASNTGTSSFPYSTTNQQMLSSIKPPLQGQSHVDNSNVTPFGMSATYDNGVPPATGTSNGNMDYVWTPTSPLSAGLLGTQNGEIYPNDKTNPTETPYSVSTPYEKQMITNIRPSLQSQSLVFNSDGGSDLSGTYNNGVSPPLGASDENIGYTGTPTSQFSAGLNLPTPQNGEIYNHDQSNPPDTSYSPFITTNQQMLGHRPPLQSQSLIDNNHGTPLDISASYDNGVPAAAGSKENNGYPGTPISQYSAGLDSPTAQNGEIYNHDQSNPSVINSDSSYSPHFTTNQQMLSLGPSLQGQSLADNSNVAPLSMSSTYENPGTDDENSRSIETPTSQYSPGLNSLTSLNSDTSSLPFSATNQQMLSLRPSLQSQSFADNSNVAPLMTASYDNAGTDDENSRSIETPTSQYSAGLNLLTSLNGVDNNHGTPLDISATYGNGVIGAAGSKENSGYTGTPISQFSAGLNLPTTQNGAIYSYDGSNGPLTNSEISPSFSTDHQIRPPLQNISPVDISEGTPSGTSVSYATDSERDPFSFDTGPGSLSNNSTILLGDSPSVKDGLHRDVMLEGNQKLTPSFITSQLENNPNYTAWRESIPDSDGLSRPRCVCTCDSNQHFFI